MAQIGVKYNDSGVGTDIAKILMQAVVGDPDRDAKMASLEADLMGAKINRERTLGLMQYEKEEAARKQGIYNYAESSIDPAAELAMDLYNRTNRPREAPVPVAPPLVVEPSITMPEGPVPVEVATTRTPPVAPLPLADPVAGGVPTPMAATAGDLSITLPEGPVPIEVDTVPVAPADMPTTPLRQAPGAIGGPGQLTAPQPGFAGGAKNNGDSITTPDGYTLSKAKVRALVAVAAHSDDPYGSLRKLTGQLGLTYGDTPEELEKAMIMLGEDPGKLPTHLGGEGGEVKESDKKGMRQEVTKAREMLTTVEPLYKSLETSLPRTDHVSDLDFIYGTATILDPGSVVRETDAVTIARSAGLAPELIGRINAVNGGAGLDRDTRLKLMALAKARIDGYRDVFDKTTRDYIERAKRNNWDPRDVVSAEDIDRLANPPAPEVDTSTPPPGWSPAQWATRSEEQKQKILADIASRAGGGG